MGNQVELSLLLVFILGWSGSLNSQMTALKTNESKQRLHIVFVCEHGAALSVVAAAYFNKIAREEHLEMHAVARGITPQKDIAVSAREGLKADNVVLDTKRPRILSAEDAAHASRIVAFCPIPARYTRKIAVERWDEVPPTGLNYGLARDAILKHLRELIRKLEADGDKP